MIGDRQALDGGIDFTMIYVAAAAPAAGPGAVSADVGAEVPAPHVSGRRGATTAPTIPPATTGPVTRRPTPASVGPGRRLRWWRELLFVAIWYVGYEAVRAASPAHAGAARAHARQLLSIERWAHLDPERTLNNLVSGSSWLGVLSGYYYGTLHFAVTPVVLIWLYWRHRWLYRRARTVLIGASAASLLVFWFYPVAPPRFAMRGLDDVVATHNVYGAGHAAKSGMFVDLYAALPSLHVGWAFWVAAVIVRACRQSRLRHLAWLYPLATALVVLATGNHYLVDAVAGITAIALTALAQRVLRTRSRSRTSEGRDTSVGVPTATAQQPASLVRCPAGRP